MYILLKNKGLTGANTNIFSKNNYKNKYFLYLYKRDKTGLYFELSGMFLFSIIRENKTKEL